MLIRVLAQKIRPPADISGIMQWVEDLLDSSIAAEGYVIREPSVEDGTDHRIDLSGIDFEGLEARFEQRRKHTEAERVKGVVARQLRKMVRLDRTLNVRPDSYRVIDPNKGEPTMEERDILIQEYNNL